LTRIGREAKNHSPLHTKNSPSADAVMKVEKKKECRPLTGEKETLIVLFTKKEKIGAPEEGKKENKKEEGTREMARKRFGFQRLEKGGEKR